MPIVCKHVYSCIGVVIFKVLWEIGVHDINHGRTGVDKDQISIDQVFLNWGGLSKIITQLEVLRDATKTRQIKLNRLVTGTIIVVAYDICVKYFVSASIGCTSMVSISLLMKTHVNTVTRNMRAIFWCIILSKAFDRPYK